MAEIFWFLLFPFICIMLIVGIICFDFSLGKNKKKKD